MTLTRIIHVVAVDPTEIEALVTREKWGKDTTIVHIGQPAALDVIGLPDGLNLYEVRVLFRTKA